MRKRPSEEEDSRRKKKIIVHPEYCAGFNTQLREKAHLVYAVEQINKEDLLWGGIWKN